MSLDHPADLARAIDLFVRMDQDTYAGWSQGAKALWQRTVDDPETLSASRRLFYSALDAAGGAAR